MTWSQTVRDHLPELLVCMCCSGQPRPALPQERDLAMKTPAVSAGCLQYKHSQGSQGEVGELWEQSGTRVRGAATLDSDRGDSDSVCCVEVRLAVRRHKRGCWRQTVRERPRLHQCSDVKLQFLQILNTAVCFWLLWRWPPALPHLMNRTAGSNNWNTKPGLEINPCNLHTSLLCCLS